MKMKKITIQMLICVGLMCVILGGYFLTKTLTIQLKEDDLSWVYQVDCIEQKGGEVVLQGFAFQIGLDSSNGNYEIMLHDLNSSENIFSEMKYVERQDVNQYFLCEYDYLKSGFIATFKNLDLQYQEYEVLVRILGKMKAYQTGIFIADGEIVFANPSEFEPLDVAGTDLEEIVKDGILRVYRSDYGMYVYQYKGALYWIAESEYEFDETKETYVQWHLETSQIENLPQYRLENQWYFDNLGFYFSENELKGWNTGEYRVAKKELPTKYSITGMNTGRYKEKKWIWQESFRPYYEFD